MAELYITEQGSKVGICGRRLIVTKDGQELLSCPVHLVQRIILEGRIQLSTAAMCLLLDRSISLILTSSKGKIRGCLFPPNNPDVSLRKKQYLLSENKSFCSAFMADMICARIHNFCTVIQRYGYNHPEFDFSTEVLQMKSLADKISGNDAIEALRGYEGSASRVYFSALVKIFQSLKIGFDSRIRRPPTDPINSVMSYIYIVLTALLTSVIQTSGMDVYCGFVHFENRNAPALALDLIEQFRQPVADRFILLMFNNRILQAEHFHHENNLPCAIKKEARNRMLEEWEKYLQTPQALIEDSSKITPMELIKLKTEQCKKHILGESEFKNFRLGRN